MRVLVTNDDGIAAPGLWTLVGELQKVADVVVAAPDGEKSAIGTAVSLRKPIKVQAVIPQVPGIVAYSVAGTPGDSVIVALDKLVSGRVDVVFSGINQGSNLGDDVFISGTVGGALQGYLHGSHAMAVSVPRRTPPGSLRRRGWPRPWPGGWAKRRLPARCSSMSTCPTCPFLRSRTWW